MKNEEEKVAIRDKMPVVTKETIDAVRAHEAAEDRRYQEECSRMIRWLTEVINWIKEEEKT